MCRNTVTSEWEGDSVFNWGQMGSSPPSEEGTGLTTLQQPVPGFHHSLQDQDFSVHHRKGSQQPTPQLQKRGKASGSKPHREHTLLPPLTFHAEQQNMAKNMSHGADVCPCPHMCQMPSSRAPEVRPLTWAAVREARTGRVCVTGLRTITLHAPAT